MFISSVTEIDQWKSMIYEAGGTGEKKTVSLLYGKFVIQWNIFEYMCQLNMGPRLRSVNICVKC